jgi:predicted amidohydrolase
LSLRVASVAWQLRRNKTDGKYFGHWHDLVSEAHDEGANVVVFPELHVLELLPLADDRILPHKAAEYLVQYGEAVEEWVGRISKSSGMIIVGGSHFRRVGEDQIQNVCAIGTPDQGVILQPKNNLTVYERDVWDIVPGKGLARLPEGLGVNVCYDSEFPGAARALAGSGMRTLCVPSWTETQRGFQRVRWSCLSRAIENGIFVIQAALVGDLGSEPVPMTYGSSMIAAPSIDPFPVEAILRETPLNEEGIVFAQLDYEMLEDARSNGEVRNWEDRDKGDWTVAP